MRLAGWGPLFVWYFTQGRPHARHVRGTFGDDYPRKAWGLPLGVAAAGIGAYLVVCVALAVATATPSPDDLAAEVRPLILDEWRKHPDLRQATIRSVTLAHRGGTRYTGVVEASVGGRPQQFALAVDTGGGSLRWTLDPSGTPADPGNRLEFRGGELFYTSAVTRAEATRLGTDLVREQFFDGDPKTVQLNRTGRTYEFRFVTKKGIEADAELIASLKAFGGALSRDVFESAPVDVHLCDEHLRTVRVVVAPR